MEGSRQHHNVTLGILTLAGTAFALQQTMVFPALPTFQEEFGASTAWTTWVLTGFLVSGAVLTPILGKLGDQFGKERLLLISLGLFLAGCLGAAAAWNIWSLIAFRIVSGAGGALFPLSFAIIRDEFPAEKVKVGIGLLSAVFGVGGGFGIVLSGVIVDHFSWRLLFVFGSVPVALSLALVHRYVPESPIRSPSRVDISGALLLSGGLLSLLVALTEGEAWGWTSLRLLGLGAAAAAFFVLWALVELRSSAPMVDMRMLSHRPVLLTNIATMISGFALFSCFVLLPAFVALVLGGIVITHGALIALWPHAAVLSVAWLACLVVARPGLVWQRRRLEQRRGLLGSPRLRVACGAAGVLAAAAAVVLSADPLVSAAAGSVALAAYLGGVRAVALAAVVAGVAGEMAFVDGASRPAGELLVGAGLIAGGLACLAMERRAA